MTSKGDNAKRSSALIKNIAERCRLLSKRAFFSVKIFFPRDGSFKKKKKINKKMSTPLKRKKIIWGKADTKCQRTRHL